MTEVAECYSPLLGTGVGCYLRCRGREYVSRNVAVASHGSRNVFKMLPKPGSKSKKGRHERRERSDRREQALIGFLGWASV